MGKKDHEEKFCKLGVNASGRPSLKKEKRTNDGGAPENQT